MTSKKEILVKKFAHFGRLEGVIFDNFVGQKSRFLDFSKLVWSCLGSVWALFSPKIEISGQNIAQFCGFGGPF